LSKVWGNLPEKERVKAMADLTAGMPAKYKALIEDYFKKQAGRESDSAQP
jgi:hypothetical protein